MDAQDRIWFGRYRGNRIGMFDTKTETLPGVGGAHPWIEPVRRHADKNGDAWTGSMLNDRIARLDTKTGQLRRISAAADHKRSAVFVDNSTTPVTFWVGSNHGASIIKLEPLD